MSTPLSERMMEVCGVDKKINMDTELNNIVN